jgi:hypothetical protein
VPEHGSGNLPAVEHVRELVIPNVDGQLIHILRVEVVPDVVVARTVIAGQLGEEEKGALFAKATAEIKAGAASLSIFFPSITKLINSCTSG